MRPDLLSSSFCRAGARQDQSSFSTQVRNAPGEMARAGAILSAACAPRPRFSAGMRASGFFERKDALNHERNGALPVLHRCAALDTLVRAASQRTSFIATDRHGKNRDDAARDGQKTERTDGG